MKKALALVIFATSTLPALAQQQSANSLQEGLFVSASGGYAWSGLHKFSEATYSKFDNTDTAYKVGLGYQHNQNLATELSYVNFGNTNTTATAGGDTTTSKNNISAFSLSEKLYATTSFGLKPFARIGVTYLRNEEQSPGETTSKISRTNMMYGLGFDYMLSQKIRLGLEYEVHGKVGTTDINGSDPARVKPRAAFITFTGSF